MNDYSNFSPSEAKDFFLLQLNLDKEIVEKYLIPRWNSYEEQWIKIIKEGIKKEEKRELAVALLLLTTEPITRSQIKNVLSQTTTDREIVENLLPFHRDVKDLLGGFREDALTLSATLVQIILKEKWFYDELLKELTMIIRQHTPKAEILSTSQQGSMDSPLHKKVQQVQAKVMEKWEEEKREKKNLVTIKSEDLERVHKALLPYVEPEEAKALKDLLSTGSTSEIIHFKGTNKQLGDFFQRLKENEKLLGVTYYTELADWLMQNFYFWHKDKKSFTPINKKSILKVLQEQKGFNKGYNRGIKY